ncbi:P-loop containing nucleoside triphosphate hydrolase protein [Crassisporium funariophilum]|nr:P-loop containing nucleoside triphosphate hydrolase protein [Crassisporium funariophilum]
MSSSYVLNRKIDTDTTSEENGAIGTRSAHRTGIIHKLRAHVASYGGTTILTFMLARLAGCITLLALSNPSLKECKRPDSPIGRRLNLHFLTDCPELAMFYTYFFASILSLLSVASRKWSTSATRCAVLILLSASGVYAWRDLWPLATYTKEPMDIAEGSILWAKIAILLFTAVVIPLFIPRPYVPINAKQPTQTPNPEHTASIISRLTYGYLDSIIVLGYKVPHLRHDQLHVLADYDYAQYMTAKAFPHLDLFGGAKRHHIFFRLLRVFRKEYTILAICIVLQACMAFIAPIGINRLLSYLESKGTPTSIRPWFWIMWLFFGPMAYSLCFNWYNFVAQRTLVRAEGLLTQLVFEHSLRIRLKAEPVSSNEEGADGTKSKDTGNLVGKMNNLVTTDLSNIGEGRDFLLIFLLAPIQGTLCIVFLYQVLGWSAFIGLAVTVLFLPIPSVLATRIATIQAAKMKTTDARVQAVTEAVNVLRMVKFFGWERKMTKRLEGKRDDELYFLFKLKILNVAYGLLSFFMPMLTVLATYATYTIVMKEELDASKIFSSMAVFSMLREEIQRVFWSLSTIIQGKVSLDRLDDFLQNSELLDSLTKLTDADDVRELVVDIDSHNQDPRIGFENATFSWSKDEDGSLTPSSRSFKLRIDGELFFKRECINLIIGPTGSGKTSMLMALLGEMHFSPSNPDSWFNLPRDGGVAYAAQESWVQNATIRENILFGSPYNEERYRKVIEDCALERDLELFEAGDNTEVGERGLTLSGGQKARVTLARAIYSPAEIILLDDVLAALDVHTSSWIIDHCFRGDLVKGRTVLLVTHNVAIASPIANFVVSIGLDGTVKTHGTDIAAALASDPTLASEVDHEKELIANEKDEIDLPDQKVPDGKLMVAEEIAHGHVTWNSIRLFFLGMGGEHPIMFFAAWTFGIFLAEGAQTLQVWFLGVWGSQYETHAPSEVNIPLYLAIYTSLFIATIVIYAISFVYFQSRSIRASRVINAQLVESIFGTTLRWLDETPTARIVARCTQDINAVDEKIPRLCNMFTQVVVGTVTKLGAVVLFTPLFIGPGLAIALLALYLGNMYLRAQLSVKREMSNARSPMLAHFSATVHGLVSIRAYGAQNSFKEESINRINHYIRAARMSYSLVRWIGIRIDALGAFFTAGLATYLVYGQSISAANTGFSLNMAVDVCSCVLYVVRSFNDLEIQANSLERIQGYIAIEHEPMPTESGKPPAAWPTSGDLLVEKLSARYSQSGPNVLHDISFHISSGQRVGVVGRTGSGKSSLTLALLRCILTEGVVFYDGIPTHQINLDALRSSITIIPQTPELLSGTLRQNLDPFEQNDDVTLNDALQAAGLFSLQEELEEEARVTLDTNVLGGGSNLSVGQRQIIALARAMVRGSKLLILDEATSAIDYKTDTVIQTTLRRQLGKDVTIITVAHRLQTILDADKIMVLDEGRIVEFDTPKILLQDERGMLRSLVDGSGDKAALYSLALGELPYD